MAFDVSALSTWSNEISDRAAILMKPITGMASFPYFEKYSGITGENYRLPTLENTPYAQAGTACGFTTSGSTVIAQKTITTVPIKIQEQICLQDLETYFTKAWLPNGSKPETLEILDTIVQRKLAQVSKKLGQMIWQGRSTYTQDTFWKQISAGIVRTIDAAGDSQTATGGGAGTALTNTTARGVFEELIFRKIPASVRSEKFRLFCGMDTFYTLLEELWIDNLYHYTPTANEMGNLVLKYPSTNVEVVAIPELNNDNAADAGGVLPTVQKNRIIGAHDGNLQLAFNAENDIKDFDVWYSKDDQVLKMNMRFHIGVAVKYTDLTVNY